jgi:carbamoyl-phosphate synthase large subunit
MKNILVTGAGAVLGQGILRSLQEYSNDFIIHTADPDHRSSGHWLGNKAHTVKMANDPDYLNSIENIIQTEKIDIVLIGTDTELPIFSYNKKLLEEKYRVIIVVSNSKVIEIANDKFLTSNFLKNNGFHFPISYMSYDQDGISLLKEQNNYPYIAKPIDGARSKGVEIINDEKDLNRVTSYRNNLVIQEYIAETDGEFTSGCLVFNRKCVAVVTLKRDLRDGNTYRAYYSDDFEKYNSFISSVAEKLGVEGPCNFQFRIKNGQPVIFEINSRFSGTTPLRFIFGFNEVKACVNYYLFNSEIEKFKLKPGVVMRTWSDIFVSEQELVHLKDEKILINPSSDYHPFKKK